jgi:hypothetical protein
MNPLHREVDWLVVTMYHYEPCQNLPACDSIADRPPSGPAHRSMFIQPSRARRDSAPNAVHRSAVSSSSTTPIWRPNGAIQQSKFIGSNAPPVKSSSIQHEPLWNPAFRTQKSKPIRAFDPTSKFSSTNMHEPVWHPSLKVPPEKPSKYFETVARSEPSASHTIERPSVSKRKVKKKPSIVSSTDPRLKERIAQAESKVKSAWQGTTLPPQAPRAPSSMNKQSTQRPPSKLKVKPTVNQPVRQNFKPNPVPAVPVDTGRSSLNDVPTAPMFQSTPMNQSLANNEFDGSFANEFDMTTRSNKRQTPSTLPAKIDNTNNHRMSSDLFLSMIMLVFLSVLLAHMSNEVDNAAEEPSIGDVSVVHDVITDKNIANEHSSSLTIFICMFSR